MSKIYDLIRKPSHGSNYCVAFLNYKARRYNIQSVFVTAKSCQNMILTAIS